MPVEGENYLGNPALEVAGFRLWIHGREFPDHQDYWDGNWLRVTARCNAPGAKVEISGSIVMVPDFHNLLEGCQNLYKDGKGDAMLNPVEPNLKVRIRPRDTHGHLIAMVEMAPEPLTDKHRFEFEIDQTDLPPIISQCEAILREYPVRGNAK